MLTFKFGEVKSSVSLKYIPLPQDPMEAYQEHLTDRRLSKSTIKNYLIDARLIQEGIRKPLVEATEADLAKYFGSLGRSDLKASTIERKKIALNSFYQWAQVSNLTSHNPAMRLPIPPKEERLKKALSAEQVKAIFSVLADDTRLDLRDALFIKALYYTGMRASEVVNLQWEQLDSDWIVVKGKGRRERKVAIVPALREVLDRWKAVHPTKVGPVFVSLGESPRQLTYDRLRGVVNRVLDRAGLAGKGFSAHSFRHTFATQLRNEGMDLDKIRILLGHRHLDTTLLYAELDLGTEVYDELTRLL